VPAPDAVAFLLAHYGLVDPPPHWLIERTTPGSDQDLAERTAPAVVEALKTTPAARIGVGIDRTDSEVRVVVGVQEIDVDLKPIPRQIARGKGVTIAGQIEPRFRSRASWSRPRRIGARARRARRRGAGSLQRRRALRRRPGPLPGRDHRRRQRRPRGAGQLPAYCGCRRPPRRRDRRARGPRA